MTEKELETIEEFCASVQPYYQLLKWGWSGRGIPQKEDLVKTLCGLVESVKSGEFRTAETGGLFAAEEEGVVVVGFKITEVLENGD